MTSDCLFLHCQGYRMEVHRQHQLLQRGMQTTCVTWSPKSRLAPYMWCKHNYENLLTVFVILFHKVFTYIYICRYRICLAIHPTALIQHYNNESYFSSTGHKARWTEMFCTPNPPESGYPICSAQRSSHFRCIWLLKPCQIWPTAPSEMSCHIIHSLYFCQYVSKTVKWH